MCGLSRVRELDKSNSKVSNCRKIKEVDDEFHLNVLELGRSTIRKQRVDGLTEDMKTFFRRPTSPCGWVVIVKPPAIQPGRQPDP